MDQETRPITAIAHDREPVVREKIERFTLQLSYPDSQFDPQTAYDIAETAAACHRLDLACQFCNFHTLLDLLKNSKHSSLSERQLTNLRVIFASDDFSTPFEDVITELKAVRSQIDSQGSANRELVIYLTALTQFYWNCYHTQKI